MRTSWAKSLGAIAGFAARAIVVRQDEDFIHAHVNGVGFAYVGELVDQIEHHLMQSWMQRTIAAAIDIFVVGIFSRRLVEFGMRGSKPNVCSAQD